MSYKIKDSDIELLRKAGVSGDDVKHCIKVAEKALEIARRTGLKLDMEIVGRELYSMTSGRQSPMR